jgi:hypothetical protein
MLDDAALPGKFDQTYGFECQWDLLDLAGTLKTNITECVMDSLVEARGYKVDEVLENFTFFNNYVGLDDNPESSPPTRGLSHFIQSVGIKENDFVVLKINVEGLEYMTYLTGSS